MKLDSVRAFKALVSDEAAQEAHATAQGANLFASSDDLPSPMPEGLALGVAKRSDGEHVVAIRTSDPILAAVMADRAHGEADVRILTVRARASRLQGRVRPLEPGAQVNISGANFVGTLGAIVRDAAGNLYALSNSHVLADVGRTPVGTAIGQPFGDDADLIGVLTRSVPLSKATANLVDCAIARLNGTTVLPRFNAGLLGDIQGVRPAGPEDLGVEVVKIGRTTDVRRGKVTAVEIDGLGVDYGDAGVLRFNDQIEVSGGAATDFSAGGDSGSLIVRADGFAIALLFAGGFDGTEDRTFGNRIENVLAALGVELAA